MFQIQKNKPTLHCSDWMSYRFIGSLLQGECSQCYRYRYIITPQYRNDHATLNFRCGCYRVNRRQEHVRFGWYRFGFYDVTQRRQPFLSLLFPSLFPFFLSSNRLWFRHWMPFYFYFEKHSFDKCNSVFCFFFKFSYTKI